MGAALSAVGSALPAAYSTHKEVKLLDRKLGILYLTCILLVLSYVVGVRVILDKGYNAGEKAYGVVGARLNGSTYMRRGGATGDTIPYDVASLVQFQESEAVFLPTRLLTTAEQTIGNCTNPNEACNSDGDCDTDPPLAAGVCQGASSTTPGGCVELQWCNLGGTTSQPLDPFAASQAGVNTADVEALQDFAGLKLVLISSIQFPTLGRATLSTEDVQPELTASGTVAYDRKFRWDVQRVLQLARLDPSVALRDGAVIGVTLSWDCNNLFDEADCVPRLYAEVLGQGRPYMLSWAHYYRRGDTAVAGESLYRDLTQARGLRLLIRAEGTGERLDALMIVTQFFVALALFPIAAYLADSIMQQLFSERRHYREYKTELSPDFSDVRAKVEQLEKTAQSRAAKAMNYGASV